MRLLYNAAEVRNALYSIRDDLQMDKNEHLFAWSKSPQGHTVPCTACICYDAKMQGVNRAIRHFGGRPRR